MLRKTKAGIGKKGCFGAIFRSRATTHVTPEILGAIDSGRRPEIGGIEISGVTCVKPKFNFSRAVFAVAESVGRLLPRPSKSMPPKPKVIESGDLGHGITYEVRPASKGSPTVHVVIDGERLPAFRRKSDFSVEAQVRALPSVKAKLEPLPSTAEEKQPRERSRSPIFNGSSLQREGSALRRDLDRLATQPLLFAGRPAAEFLVLSIEKVYPDDSWLDLRGVWAQQSELVNGRPAYTLAYRWADAGPAYTLHPDGSRHNTAMWFAPVAARGGGAGEAMPGWIIGLACQLGQGHEHRPADHGYWLVNTDSAPLPDLIRRTWQRRGVLIRASLERLLAPPTNVVLFKDGNGRIIERPANSQRRRHFAEQQCFLRRQARPLRLADCASCQATMTRCDEVESACYWRRRKCFACGASGPVDGRPREDGDVELELCGCGVVFCRDDSASFSCSLRTQCPHIEDETVDYRVSNEILASGHMLCNCACCKRRVFEPPQCDVCYGLPCECDGRSEWKVLHGEVWAARHMRPEEAREELHNACVDAKATAMRELEELCKAHIQRRVERARSRGYSLPRLFDDPEEWNHSSDEEIEEALVAVYGPCMSSAGIRP